MKSLLTACPDSPFASAQDHWVAAAHAGTTRSSRRITFGCFIAFAACSVSAQVASLPNVTLEASEVIDLWPGTAPGESGGIGPEHVLPNRPRPFDQLADVSVPTLSVFQPASQKRTGTGILVIPGGGLDRLAIEHEGYEVAEWLNAHGITAFLLKHRVPARSQETRWKAGLQDAQRDEHHPLPR